MNLPDASFVWPAFLLDAWLVAAFGASLALRLGGAGTALLCLRGWVLSSLLVVASVLGCGLAGVLRWETWLCVHAVAVCVVAAVHPSGFGAGMRDVLCAPARVVARVWVSAVGVFGESGLSARLLAGSLAVLLGICFFSALTALPLNYDSNVYRLPRIGLWLQEARWTPIAGGSRHLHHMPYYGEFLMLWVAGFGRVGFPMIGVVQWVAGVAMMGAAWWLCRGWGFSRFGCLGAVLTILACLNVATQMSTSQTDLLVAGYAWAGLAVLMPGSRRPGVADFLLSGAAFGLAAGCKGTVFYFVPAAGVMMLVFLWRQRVPWALARSGMAAVLLASIVVAAPPYLENIRRFANPLGPGEAIQRFHGTASEPRLERLLITAELHLRFQFLPSSNPLLPATLFAALNESSIERIRSLPSLPRREKALSVLYGMPRRPHEDFSTLGVLPLGLAVSGLGVAVVGLLRRRDGRAGFVVWAAVATVAWLVLFGSLYRWSPFSGRFLTLAAPSAGIAAGYLLMVLPGVPALVAGGLLVAQAFAGVVYGQHHGLLIALSPRRSPSAPGYFESREFAAEVARRGGRLVIATRMPMWTGSYWRTGDAVRIGYPEVPLQWTAQQARELLAATGADVLLANRRLFPAGDPLPPDRFRDEIVFFKP